MYSCPGNTAIKRSKLSRPMQWLVDAKFLLAGTGRIPAGYHWLDLGCGRGDDVLTLQQRKYNITGFDTDPRWACSRLAVNGYNIITLNYVINVIPQLADRITILREAFRLLRRYGYLFISARTKKEVNDRAAKGMWLPCGDGFMSSLTRGTFQKGFDSDDLFMLLKDIRAYYHVIRSVESPFSGLLIKKGI